MLSFPRYNFRQAAGLRSGLRAIALLALLGTAFLPLTAGAQTLPPHMFSQAAQVLAGPSGGATQLAIESQPPVPLRPAPVVGTGGQPDPTSRPNTLFIRLGGLLAALLAALAVLLGGGGLLLLRRAPTPVRARLDRFVAEHDTAAAQPNGPPAKFTVRVLYPLCDKLGQRLTALTPGRYLDKVQSLLYQAGPPYLMQPTRFLGIQVGLGGGGLIVALLWAFVVAPHEPLKWPLFAGGGLVAGCFIPYYQLGKRVAQRKKRLLRALPAALDFLVIMIEAGTGLDSALVELTRRWHNPLSAEFALMLLDFQIGKARRAAWHDLVTRTQVPELNSFVLAMVQSEVSGAGIGGALRTQAEQMRTRRRQAAEEQARMAPVKMMIPMALFIFPCIMIVILGPALPQLFLTLGHLGH